MAGKVLSPASRIVAWQRRHGRHDLPWQNTREAYRIWLSEVMLQQTQVSTVIPYYTAFLKRFPTVQALATAPLDDVLALWSGLGYYSRARNLHKAAQAIIDQYGGRMPEDPSLVEALPGIGRSTAAAICVFAHGGRHAILDGNVKRVLARYHGVRGSITSAAVLDQLWRHAGAMLPRRHIEAYSQGLMDLGATTCLRKNPVCEQCPLQAGCVAHRDGLTKVLPEPRPRAAVPQRKTMMLILRCKDKILLEKRITSGIWGGLWSLPETAAPKDLARVCNERYGVQLQTQTALPPLAHAFTHFSLHIKPLLLTVQAPGKRGDKSASVRWFSKSTALAAGIPAPIRKILLSICF